MVLTGHRSWDLDHSQERRRRLQNGVTVILRAVLLLLLATIVRACTAPPASSPASSAAPPTPTQNATATPSATAPATPVEVPPSASEEGAPEVIVAAGDIADCTLDGGSATAALIAERPEAAVAALGDLVYPYGTDQTYAKCFMPT